jgi:hypothetical protein
MSRKVDQALWDQYRGHSEDEGTPADPIEDFKQRFKQYRYYAGTEIFVETFVVATVGSLTFIRPQSDKDKVGETDDGPSGGGDVRPFPYLLPPDSWVPPYTQPTYTPLSPGLPRGQ